MLTLMLTIGCMPGMHIGASAPAATVTARPRRMLWLIMAKPPLTLLTESAVTRVVVIVVERGS